MQDNWSDALFQSVYERIYAVLTLRRRRDESAEAIRDQLKWEYEAEGINWVGKGEVWQVTQEATIAAYEAFLAAWEEESESTKSS